MQNPQITYRGMPPSPAMDARILEQFEVRVDVHVPGREIVATNQRHEDAYAAITSAFDVVVRRLEEGLEIQRGEVKRHREESGDNSLP